MGSLFDELKKSKLIDKRRAKQLAHEQRVESKKAGGDLAKDDDLARKHEEFKRLQEEERKRNRELEKKRQAAAQERQRLAELKQLVQSRALGDEAGGGRRWHFATPAGTLPFLPVDETTSRRLQAGEYAIVRDPNHAWARYVIVPREVALALRRVDEKAVCYITGG